MEIHDIIVIGASSGGIEALSRLLPTIPQDIPAAILVVVHTAPNGPGYLASILQRNSRLHVVSADDGAEIKRGTVYVAVPNRHLRVSDGKIQLGAGPLENRVRPAIDVLFRSAAVAYGPRVIGVVLTGNLDDGSGGLKAIADCGGITVVQDPEEATWPSMPRSAIRATEVDYIAKLDEMGRVLSRLAELEAGERPDTKESAEVAADEKMSRTGLSAFSALQSAREGSETVAPTSLTCPDCGGPLMRTEGADVAKGFRCVVGHSLAPKSLLGMQNDIFERSLWTAVRVLKERAALFGMMSNEALEKGRERVANMFAERARESEAYANALRSGLINAVGEGETDDSFLDDYDDESKR
jgi:two-component system, chemotaxis family, protein-glutamate methylesterase/glutaminase